MENFHLSYEWRQEKNRFYVQSTKGTDDTVAVNLNTIYRDKAEAYNQAQIEYNKRVGIETTEKLQAAKLEYEAARENLLIYIRDHSSDPILSLG